jgi:hypothetical protein
MTSGPVLRQPGTAPLVSIAMTVPGRRGGFVEAQNPNRFSGHFADADNPDQERMRPGGSPVTHQAGAGRRDIGASRTDSATS